MSALKLLKLSVALAAIYVGAASADERKDESGKGKRDPPAVHYPYDREHDDERGSYFHRHGYDRLSIPAGHYPRPGECRIWYPGRPAGTSPLLALGYLRTRVQQGAWLIRHPEDDDEHVHVIVYDTYRPGGNVVIGEFDIGTGVFVRILVE